MIRLPNWVGDIALALPAVAAIRAAWPAARIVGVARDAHCGLARRIGVLDEVLPAPAGRGPARAASVWRLARRLRWMRAAAAVVLAPSFEAALTVWLAGIPRRIGHRTDRRAALLTDAVAPDRNGHRADGFLALAARVRNPAGCEQADRSAPVEAPGAALVLTADDRRYAQHTFAAAGWPEDALPVFVNPAAAKAPRAWSPARFRALVETLARRAPGRRFLVHDRSPFEAPSGWLAAHGAAGAGGATLPQLCALLERCAVYVGNDSGPAHLAAALGLPTVTIFGPSAPGVTGPRPRGGAAAVEVGAAFACSPCRERFFEECPSPPTLDGRPPCLDAIPVERVAAAVERALAASAGTGDRAGSPHRRKARTPPE
ncbi:MAG: glycosyltransferase family 9 protein [Acidobacteria bacterium]|nr:glycosyltransferase family 9 protein [Acidobacteriota bacterium]